MSEGIGNVTCDNVAIENRKSKIFETKCHFLKFYEIKLQKLNSDVPNPFDIVPRDLYLVSHACHMTLSQALSKGVLLSMKISLDIRM